MYADQLFEGGKSGELDALITGWILISIILQPISDRGRNINKHVNLIESPMYDWGNSIGKLIIAHLVEKKI